MRLGNICQGYAEVFRSGLVPGLPNRYLGHVVGSTGGWFAMLHRGDGEYEELGGFHTRRAASFAVYNAALTRGYPR
jgi:hypothetical protein